MGNILQRSLKARLFVVFLLVSVVSVSTLGAIAYFFSSGAMRKEIVGNYNNLNSVSETLLIQILDDAKGVFTLLAQNRFISESIAKVVAGDPNSQELLKEVTQSLSELKNASDHMEEIFIADLSGKIIASTQEIHVGVDESQHDYFVKGQKDFFIADIYKSKRTGAIGYVMSGPLRAGDSKKEIGVFATRFNTGAFEEAVCDYSRMGDSEETYIVNKDGFMVTSSRFVKDAVLKQKVDTAPVKLWRSQKKEMAGVYTGYQGGKVLGVATGNKLSKIYGNLGWLLVTDVNEAEAFAPVRRLGAILILVGLILSVLVAIIAYLVAQSIVSPIVLMVQAAKRVGEGDLTVDIAETNEQDEIGVLSRALRRMVVGLKTLISQVSGVAERVSASGQELSSSAQEMNATTEEVSSTVQQISKGTETQAQKVEDLRKVIEEMASSILQVSKGAREASVQAVKAAETAMKGGESSKEAQEKMVHIAEAVTSSADTVKKLGRRSDQMEDIVNIIVGIASQTNLLALNAAIEAARAGEYGRGFAVVAEEVRKLAEGSAKAADEIGKLIKDIQKDTMLAVSTIEGASKEASAVKDIAQKVADGLSEIIKNTESVASAVEQVSATNQQQALGTKVASQSATDIAAVAEETAASTEEASASTEEMTASMEQMAASAQELADMGMTLRDAVAKFKIGKEIIPQPAAVNFHGKEESSRMAKLREQAETVRRRMEVLRSKRQTTGEKKS
jgi:methyl-accepting chemotaxis protein